MTTKPAYSWKVIMGGLVLILIGVAVLQLGSVMLPECGDHTRSMCTGKLSEYSFDSYPEVKWFIACIFFFFGGLVTLLGTPIDGADMFGTQKKDES